MTQVYDGFLKNKNMYAAKIKATEHTHLPAGVYKFAVDPDSGQGFFIEQDTLCDKIVDLDTKEYKLVTNQIEQFLKEETKQKYSEYEFIYKRSVLLHGKPGTGKTQLVNRIAIDVINKNGVVIFNPHPQHLELCFKYLGDIEAERLKMVIFEELDSILEHYESELLHILDGEVQVSNIIYAATTNHINEIPKRIQRPGRFSLVIEVHPPSQDAIEQFLRVRLKASDLEVHDVKEWAKKCHDKKMTIDEVKETILSVVCLDGNLDEAINRVAGTTAEEIESNQQEDYEIKQQARNLGRQLSAMFK